MQADGKLELATGPNPSHCQLRIEPARARMEALLRRKRFDPMDWRMSFVFRSERHCVRHPVKS
jgi:hypothetical protein